MLRSLSLLSAETLLDKLDLATYVTVTLLADLVLLSAEVSCLHGLGYLLPAVVADCRLRLVLNEAQLLQGLCVEVGVGVLRTAHVVEYSLGGSQLNGPGLHFCSVGNKIDQVAPHHQQVQRLTVALLRVLFKGAGLLVYQIESHVSLVELVIATCHVCV